VSLLDFIIDVWDVDRGWAQSSIEQGAVFVNGVIIKDPGHMVFTGDIVRFWDQGCTFSLPE